MACKATSNDGADGSWIVSGYHPRVFCFAGEMIRWMNKKNLKNGRGDCERKSRKLQCLESLLRSDGGATPNWPSRRRRGILLRVVRFNWGRAARPTRPS